MEPAVRFALRHSIDAVGSMRRRLKGMETMIQKLLVDLETDSMSDLDPMYIAQSVDEIDQEMDEIGADMYRWLCMNSVVAHAR